MTRQKSRFEERSFERLNKMAETEYARQAKSKEIANDFPECVDPKRKKKALKSLLFFLKTYFKDLFSLKFSDMHLDVIKKIEETINNKQLYCLAMPRGSGKTTMTECAILWSILTGKSKCAVLVCANASRAKLLLRDIYSLIVGNELLVQDFPEAIYPFYMTSTSPRRLKSLTYKGNPLCAEVMSERIVFPNIDPLCAESVLFTAGLTGSGLRGLAYTTSGGQKLRPDFVLCDDPQDRESAASFEQTKTRERLVKADMLGMAGAGKEIACLVTCTVIEQDDLADRLLNRQENPEFHGQRYSLLESMPKNLDLWEQYNAIREDELRNDDSHDKSKEFYRQHHKEMNEGAVCTWKERYDKQDIDALTYAMRLYFRDKDSFFSEYQNQPLDANKDFELTSITSGHCSAKLNQLPRNYIEDTDVSVTAFIDVHKTLLYYAVCAWGNNFSGRIIDYGVYPENSIANLNHSNPKRSLEDVYKGYSMEDSISLGLTQLVNDILHRDYISESGVAVPISKVLIDANWGETTDVVYQTIKSFRNPIVSPSHGVYVGATGKPFGKGYSSNGDKVGDNWRIPGKTSRHGVRYVLFDTNFWKTFFMKRLLAPKGTLSSITLFGNEAKEHELLIQHLSAEYFTEVTAFGGTRRVNEWKLKPSAHDNHWLDCCVGCCVGASISGLTLNQSTPHVSKRRRVYEAFRRNQL